MQKNERHTTGIALRIAAAIAGVIGVVTILAIAGLLPATFIEKGVCGPPEGPTSESPAECARAWFAILIGVGTIGAAIVAGLWAWSGVQYQVRESKNSECLRAMREDLAALDTLLAQCLVYEATSQNAHMELNKKITDVVRIEHLWIFYNELLSVIAEFRRISGSIIITFVTSVEREAITKSNELLAVTVKHADDCANIANSLRYDIHTKLIGRTKLAPFKILEQV